MSWGPMKRFWSEVTVEPLETGFAVRLDGRGLKTPAKADLLVPCRGLADRVAAEWAAVEGEVDPTPMRYTRAANAAIDKVAVQLGAVADMLAAYGGTDLLCYRATEPVELIARQMETWDPLLDWAAETLGARLETTQGVVPVDQDAAALAALSGHVQSFNAFELTAFHDLVTISGSLIIALSVTQGRIDAAFGWTASRIDEIFQEEQWGEDDEATALAASKQQDFMTAAEIYDLLQGD